jgi:hypothetical protein
VNADTTVTTITDRGYASLLRASTILLTVVAVASFALVGAIAPAVLSLVVGGTVAAVVRASRPVTVVLAGIVGLAMTLLAGNYLVANSTPSELGDQLFVYAGGLLGLATVVLAGMVLVGSRRQ